jgi:hypothetical protein
MYSRISASGGRPLVNISIYFVVTTQRTITKTKQAHTSGQAITKSLGITNWAMQNIAISNNP